MEKVTKERNLEKELLFAARYGMTADKFLESYVKPLLREAKGDEKLISVDVEG